MNKVLPAVPERDLKSSIWSISFTAMLNTFHYTGTNMCPGFYLN
jgi:hypothetical protein